MRLLRQFTARKTNANDCVACHHQRGIWRDPDFAERYLCDDCFATHLEQLDAKQRDRLKQYRAMGMCHG